MVHRGGNPSNFFYNETAGFETSSPAVSPHKRAPLPPRRHLSIILLLLVVVVVVVEVVVVVLCNQKNDLKFMASLLVSCRAQPKKKVRLKIKSLV